MICTTLSPSAATFISFLLEVDSVYEVHDYIKSYLGETKDAHDFAKQFLERRQKLKPSGQPQQHGQVGVASGPTNFLCTEYILYGVVTVVPILV